MKHLTYIWFILILGILLTSCKDKVLLSQEEEQWLEQNDSITIALFPYYAPYQFLGRRGEDEGIFVDYLTLMESKIGYSFDRKIYTSWPEVLEDAKNGNIELILEAQSTAQRRKYLNFYPIFYESRFVIVTPKGQKKLKNVKQLAGKTVNIPEGFAIRDIINEAVKDVQITSCRSESECLSLLAAGTGDAYIGPESVANYHIKSLNLNQLRITGSVDGSYNPGIAVTKDNDILNRIISKASSSITYEEKKSLIENWLFTYKKPWYQRYEYWTAFAILLFLLAFLAFMFNKYLDIKIKKRELALTDAKTTIDKDTQVQLSFIKNASKKLLKPMRELHEKITEISDTPYTDSEPRITDDIVKLSREMMTSLDEALGFSSNTYEPKRPTPLPESKTTERKKKKVKILIAEDDEVNLYLLERILDQATMYDFEVFHAADGDQAVQIARRVNNLDLIFMDVKMPVMDGFEATKVIKKEQPKLPIIVQTAYVSPQDVKRAANAGCDGYISKPIDADKLMQEVGNVLHYTAVDELFK